VILVVVEAYPKWNELEGYTFSSYVRDYGKSYSDAEYRFREEIFNKNLIDIKQHNTEDHSWKKGVNHLTDQTEEEWGSLLGLNKGLLHRQKVEHKGPTLRSKRSDLPDLVDWRDKGIITPVKDQGNCGSCWTFGTAETIESFWALKYGSIMEFSEQQILDCTPNPNDCGGTGGCGGGTAQIAMDRIMKMGGITTEWRYPYVSYFGNAQTCKFSSNNMTVNPVAKLQSWVRLEMNDQDTVIAALASTGPLIINVDASAWASYESGVFNGCNQTNPDINHVVQLVGYGPDYWLVRNSWSSLWGDNGYIRLMKDSTVPCGIDLNPQDGDICNGGPTTVKVCGTCGIVYDVTYPIIS